MKNYFLAATSGNEIGNPALGNFGSTHGPEFFGRLVPAGIGLAFLVGALIFFFMLVVWAIQWISSGGDKQALEGARSRITNALIGVIILFATFAVVKLIESFFHISIIDLNLNALRIGG